MTKWRPLTFVTSVLLGVTLGSLGLMDFLMNFLILIFEILIFRNFDFLEDSFLSIASFRIGVPSILFVDKSIDSKK